MSETKPRWADLFGIDPDFTGGLGAAEYLRQSRGESKPGCWFHPKARLHDCCDCRAVVTE